MRKRVEALLKNLYWLRFQFKIAADIDVLEPGVRAQVIARVMLPDPLCHYTYCSPKCPWNQVKAEFPHSHDCIRALFGGFSYYGICCGSVEVELHRESACINLAETGIKLSDCDNCITYLQAMQEWTLLPCWGQDYDEDLDEDPLPPASTLESVDLPELPALLATFPDLPVA